MRFSCYFVFVSFVFVSPVGKVFALLCLFVCLFFIIIIIISIIFIIIILFVVVALFCFVLFCFPKNPSPLDIKWCALIFILLHR